MPADALDPRPALRLGPTLPPPSFDGRGQTRRPASGAWDDALRMATPAAIHMGLVAATFVGDRALVGRLMPEGLAAIHLPSTVLWTLTSVVGAMASAALAVVGRRHGEDRATGPAVVGALELAWRAGMITAVVGAALGAGLLWTLVPGLRDAALVYLLLALPAVPFAAVQATVAGSLQAVGDARTPLALGAIGAVAHLGITAAVMSTLPETGIAGAALGASFGFGVQATLGWVVLRQRFGLRADGDTVKEARGALWMVARGAVAEKLALHLGLLGYAAAIAGLGAEAMAANQALLSVESVAFPVAEGCGIAAASLVARRLGARDPRGALRYAGMASALAGAVLVAFGVLVLAAPGAWLTVFGVDSPTARTVAPYLALAQPPMAVAVVGAMALRGAGATHWALGITAAGTVLRLVGTWFFAFVLEAGLPGAWLASAVDWGLQALLFGVVLRRVLTRPGVLA